jgi:hypothetical protein
VEERENLIDELKDGLGLEHCEAVTMGIDLIKFVNQAEQGIVLDKEEPAPKRPNPFWID